MSKMQRRILKLFSGWNDMGKCPHCNSYIDSLNAYSMEENKQEVTLGEGTYNEKPFLEYGATETIDSSCSKIDFECPNCNEIIFSNGGDSQDTRVIKFLKESKGAILENAPAGNKQTEKTGK